MTGSADTIYCMWRISLLCGRALSMTSQK